MFYIEKKKKYKRLFIMFAWILLLTICVWKNINSSAVKTEERRVLFVGEAMLRHLEESIVNKQFPLLAFADGEWEEKSVEEWMADAVVGELSCYVYYDKCEVRPLQTESKSTYELMIEREEGRDEEEAFAEDIFLPDNAMAESLVLENEQAKADKMAEENKNILQ